MTVLIFGLVSCSDSNDRGDGFKSTQTKKKTTTTISKKPILSQPCSLLSVEQASELMQASQDQIEEPESSKPDQKVLRCRYATTTEDQKRYVILNIYVYKDQASFDQVREINKAKPVETTVDEGFYFEKNTIREAERFVAARQGDTRIAVSSTISVINPDDELSAGQITLPTTQELALQLSNILEKL